MIPMETQDHNKQRFIELDLIRGFAISMMVVFHLLWDLDYYGLSPLDQKVYGIGQYFPIIFFGLVGICLVISSQHRTQLQIFFRGVWILVIGFSITLVSMVVIPNKPITFGVLHCIGISIIISSFFVKRKLNAFYPGVICIVAGLLISMWQVQNPSMIQLALGIHQQDLWRYTVDYFPLLPWFGVVLIGIAMGKILYRDGKRQFPFPDISKIIPVRVASVLGRNSLVIYLVHQPVIAGTIIYAIPLIARIF